MDSSNSPRQFQRSPVRPSRHQQPQPPNAFQLDDIALAQAQAAGAGSNQHSFNQAPSPINNTNNQQVQQQQQFGGGSNQNLNQSQEEQNQEDVSVVSDQQYAEVRQSQALPANAMQQQIGPMQQQNQGFFGQDESSASLQSQQQLPQQRESVQPQQQQVLQKQQTTRMMNQQEQIPINNTNFKISGQQTQNNNGSNNNAGSNDILNNSQTLMNQKINNQKQLIQSVAGIQGQSDFLMNPNGLNNRQQQISAPAGGNPNLNDPQMVQAQKSSDADQPTTSWYQPIKLCQCHGDQLILFCLKCQEPVCARCLNSTHLLHPVVPLNSVDKLDFEKTIHDEIKTSVSQIKAREEHVKRNISEGLRSHKLQLRSHIIKIRDNLQDAFEDFFNSLLSNIRKDWNLFSVQEMLVKETARFNTIVTSSLTQITENKSLFDLRNRRQEEDLRRFYEQLSDAQLQVQNFKEDWYDYESTVTNLLGCLKNHSEFDVIDAQHMRSFMAENFVMNYSNIELHRIVAQQKQAQELTHQQQQLDNNNARPPSGQQQSPRANMPRGSFSQVGPGQNNNNQGIDRNNNLNNQNNNNNNGNGNGLVQGNGLRNNDRPQTGHPMGGGGGYRPHMGADQYQQNMQQRPSSAYELRNGEMRSTNQNMGGAHGFRGAAGMQVPGHGGMMALAQNQVNRIHFFKFDQKIVTYYDVDNDRRSREQLLQDFNIPIRFCSIQTSDGKIFITGGAKNTTQSSSHAYELRDQTLVQLPNMLNPREGHCLAAIGNNYIYAIGSRLYNTSKTCEVYSIQRQQWREQPDLNRNRYLSTAVTIADRYIYVMGGYEPSVTDIERLDTESGEAPYWELIKVWSQSFENDIKYWFGACPINNREILIFGGKKDGQSSASSYIFDTQMNQISKTSNMPSRDTFYQRTFLCRNNKVYAYGYENETAYIYNITSGTWARK